jgi:DNA-binding response OmpR family regulator
VAQARKILIVEDEEILAENIMAYIQRCGWEGRIASTGKLAVMTADDFQPEIILLDYHLPDMNGFQTLDAIRNTCKPCGGCILMTGHPTDTVMNSAIEHGIRRILCKPFSLKDLNSCLLASADEFSLPATLISKRK